MKHRIACNMASLSVWQQAPVTASLASLVTTLQPAMSNSLSPHTGYNRSHNQFIERICANLIRMYMLTAILYFTPL